MDAHNVFLNRVEIATKIAERPSSLKKKAYFITFNFVTKINTHNSIRYYTKQ